MIDPFFAWTEAGAPARLRWRGAGGVWSGGDHRACAAAAAGRPVVVLVDGADLTVLETALPASDLRTARQALPYAIEDALASPLEELEFALTRTGPGHWAAAVMRADLHAALVAALAEGGLSPVLVTTEYDALPVPGGGCAIHVMDDRATVRAAAHGGIKLRLADLHVLPAVLGEKCGPGASVRVYGASEPPPGWPAQFGAALAIEWRPVLDTAAMWDALTAQPPLILCEPAAAVAARRRAARLWRAVAAVALVTALAYPAVLALRNAALTEAVDGLAAANRATFAATFPEVARVVNPRVQADQALAALRAREARPPLLLELLTTLDTLDLAALPAGTRIARASFNGGVLELGVETAGMAELDQVRAALERLGLVAEMLAAEAIESGVQARLRVRAA